MPVFLEKFALPCIVALVGIIIVNAIKFDIRQRVSLIICVISAAYFVSHTLQMRKTTVEPTHSKSISSPMEQKTGNASSEGDQSPANTGDGNSFVYGQKPSKEHKSTLRKKKP